MALVDSGSTASVIHPDVLSRISWIADVHREHQSGQLRLADGGVVYTQGSVKLLLKLGTDSVPIQHDFIVAAIEAPAVVGLDFMRAHGCILNVTEGTLVVEDKVHMCSTMQHLPSCFRIAMAETVIVPPYSEMVIPGVVQGQAHFTEGLIENLESPLCDGHVALAKLVVNPAGGDVPLRVVNMGYQSAKLHQGMIIASCEPAQVMSMIEEESSDNELNSDTVKVEHELPSCMSPILDEYEHRLSDSEIRESREMLKEELVTFAKSRDDIGTTDVATHRMKMVSSQTSKESARRLPLSRYQVVKDELSRMQRLGVIEPSNSAWASPIVLVTKKDGTIRFCVDFRRVNNLTIKDSYPLPRIDDTIDALRGSSWFSTLDLASGYWQVPMAPEDAEKTAFTTPFGLFQFKKMPFGLANAPATFERLMDLVLAGLHWDVCLVYLDDIIVFSQSFKQHVQRLQPVLERLRQAGLKLSPSKCHLFQPRVEFLGYVVSGDGVSTDPKKTEAIDKWPTPRSVRDVRSFLGLCSYYRRFVKGFADIAKPLYVLTQQDVVFVWSDECQEAFQNLKAALTSPPILAYPSESDAFILDTDASSVGIGAVLSQVQNGTERVIAYFSRVLNPAERNYCVTRRELLAMVCAVNHFHHYLCGRHFLVRFDHGSLRWLMNFRNLEGQMGRWLAFLNNYDFVIQHRPGKSHGNADALSHRSCTVCDFCERREQQELAVLAWDGDDQHFCGLLVADNPDVSQQWFESYSPTQLRHWQDDDPVLHKVLQWVESGSKPSWQDIQSEGSSLRQYWSSFAHLELKDGVLYRRCDDALSSVQTLRLVAPPAIRDKIFHFLHSCRTGGHLGINRTVSSVRRRFWWSGMKTDVMRWCQHCDRCQRRNHRSGPGRAPLHQEPVGSPMERIAFDILSFPQETDLGNKCVLVVCDYFTKWTEAFPLKDHQATTVADTWMTQIFLRFGVPRIIHSDQAPEFTSELMQELFRLLEIQQTRTCPYRPQSDGLVERFNRTLIDMLSKFCGDYTQDWDEHIPYLLCAYRASVNESTGCSPNHLMLGREILLPIDLMFPCNSLPSYKCRTEYVEWVKKTMEDNFERVRFNLKSAAQRQKRYFDDRTKLHQFRKGDWVLRFYPPNLRNKLKSLYIGPYLVISQPGAVTYTLQRDPSHRPVTVHVDHIKRYHSENLPQSWLGLSAGDQSSGALGTTGQGDHSNAVTDTLLDQYVPLCRSSRRRQLPGRFANFDMF